MPSPCHPTSPVRYLWNGLPLQDCACGGTHIPKRTPRKRHMVTTSDGKFWQSTILGNLDHGRHHPADQPPHPDLDPYPYHMGGLVTVNLTQEEISHECNRMNTSRLRVCIDDFNTRSWCQPRREPDLLDLLAQQTT